MINAIKIALSGLMAASRRTEVVASNIANMTTGGSLGSEGPAPYRALTAQQTAITDSEGNGLWVKTEVVPKNPPFTPAYDPDSPFANEEGIIGVPNVDLAEEAINLNLAEIAFKAGLKVIQTASDMEEELLKTFDKKV